MKWEKVKILNDIILLLKALLLLSFVFSSTTQAQEIISKETGFSGYIRLSYGYLNIRTNSIARFLNNELSQNPIASLNENPARKNLGILTFPFELSYTFIPEFTQVYIGNDLEDLLRFDVSQQLGIKQRINKVGIFKVAMLYSSIPTKVWEDPFIINELREETRRTSFGGRITWDMLMFSKLRLQYSYRDIVISNEQSGNYLNLSKSKKSSLNRNGGYHSVELLYRYYIAGNSLVIPSISFVFDDRKGEAVKKRIIDFKLTYSLSGRTISSVSNLIIGYSKNDSKNPIFGVTQENIRYGLTSSVFYKNPWGWKVWGSKPINFVVTLGYYSTDTNIKFYQHEAFIAQLGVFSKW